VRIASLIALPPQQLAALESSPFGPFACNVCTGRDEALALLNESGVAALILDGDDAELAHALMANVLADLAVIVVVAAVDSPGAIEWLQRGAQDVLAHDELADASLAYRLRAAIERKRRECDARTAYATDVDTGLPHQQQLIEHMSQLIALREREPAPMALLALRIEGLATTEVRLGREAAHVLRRKVGVRLRAGVRASDVVASLGDDQFAVLLGSILAPADAARVGVKLMKALLEPFKIAGQDVAVAAALGIAQHPQDGPQPEALLRRAVGLAAAAPAQGRAGFSNFGEAGPTGAANDD
jgi:diguanylate cyclase (GGDEF)-like protein